MQGTPAYCSSGRRPTGGYIQHLKCHLRLSARFKYFISQGEYEHEPSWSDIVSGDVWEAPGELWFVGSSATSNLWRGKQEKKTRERECCPVNPAIVKYENLDFEDFEQLRDSRENSFVKLTSLIITLLRDLPDSQVSFSHLRCFRRLSRKETQAAVLVRYFQRQLVPTDCDVWKTQIQILPLPLAKNGVILSKLQSLWILFL